MVWSPEKMLEVVPQLHNLICLHNLTCNKAFISIGCTEAETKLGPDKLGSIIADLTLGMRHKQQLPSLKSAIRVNPVL